MKTIKKSSVILSTAILLLTVINVLSAMSSPTVSLSQNLEQLHDGKVSLSVSLSGVSEQENIMGYFLRLDYDENMLSNPVPVLSNTLSEDYFHLIAVPVPKDGIGKLSSGIWLNAAQSQNGTLIKIQFDPLPGFVNGRANMKFISLKQKTMVFDDRFEKIEAAFIPCAGDIDGNGLVNMTDAIVGLQILAGIKPAIIEQAADINGDQKTGLQEIVYILQSLTVLD